MAKSAWGQVLGRFLVLARPVSPFWTAGLVPAADRGLGDRDGVALRVEHLELEGVLRALLQRLLAGDALLKKARRTRAETPLHVRCLAGEGSPNPS